MDRGADFLKGTAAADIGNGSIDIGIGRLRLIPQQRGGRHHHARLAVPALGRLVLYPGLLHLGQLAVYGKALNGFDLLALEAGNRHRTGSQWQAIDQHRARAADADAAAIFGAGQPEVIAQHPEQRGLGIDIESVLFAVDGQLGHGIFSGAAQEWYVGRRGLSDNIMKPAVNLRYIYQSAIKGNTD